jgi:hypothetical protein
VSISTPIELLPNDLKRQMSSPDSKIMKKSSAFDGVVVGEIESDDSSDKENREVMSKGKAGKKAKKFRPSMQG